MQLRNSQARYGRTRRAALRSVNAPLDWIHSLLGRLPGLTAAGHADLLERLRSGTGEFYIITTRQNVRRTW